MVFAIHSALMSSNADAQQVIPASSVKSIPAKETNAKMDQLAFLIKQATPASAKSASTVKSVSSILARLIHVCMKLLVLQTVQVLLAAVLMAFLVIYAKQLLVKILHVRITALVPSSIRTFTATVPRASAAGTASKEFVAKTHACTKESVLETETILVVIAKMGIPGKDAK